MLYRSTQDAEGCYAAADGTRYTVSSCRSIRTPGGQNVGWSFFPNLAAYLAEQGLVYAPATEETPQPEPQTTARE